MLSMTALALTVAEADAYVASRGRTGWGGTDPVKTAALRRGQDYIAGMYNARWTTDFDNDAAPDEVKYAITEAALRELAAAGSLAPDVTPAAQKVLVQVEGIRWERLPGGTSVVPVLTAVEALLTGLVTGGNTVMLIRA